MLKDNISHIAIYISITTENNISSRSNSALVLVADWLAGRDLGPGC